MTTTSTPPTTTSTPPTTSATLVSHPSTGALWRTGLLAGLAGGIAALAVGALGVALDVPMTASQAGGTIDVIPLPAFVIATLVATAIGIVLAVQLRKRAARPARTFLVVALLATLLSLVQPFFAAPDIATAVVLDLSHLAAAVVVIPVLTRALPVHR